VPASVVVQLLDEIALLLAPDDRNRFWIVRYAALAVAGCAELHLGLDIVRARLHGRNCESNGDCDHRRGETRGPHVIPPSRDCPRLREVSRQSVRGATRSCAARVSAASIAPCRFWGLFEPTNGVTLPQPDGDRSNQPRPKGMERQQSFFRERPHAKQIDA